MRGSVVVEPFIASSHHHENIIVLELIVCIGLELTVARSSVAKIEQLAAILDRSGNRRQPVGNIGPASRTELRLAAPAELIENPESPDLHAIRNTTYTLPVADGAGNDARDKRTVTVLIERQRIVRVPIIPPDIIDEPIKVVVDAVIKPRPSLQFLGVNRTN